MPRNNDFLARSERNGRDGRKRSRGRHTGQTPNEVAGRRPRDLESGVDNKSAHACATVKSTSDRARELDRAAMASDRSGRRKAPQTVRARTKRRAPRIEDPDLGDDSSGAGVGSSTSEASSESFLCPPPRPYDGKADQDAFDEWSFRVENWAEINELSRKEVMCWFPQFVTGDALCCWQEHVFPSLHSRKWKLKEVFEVLQSRCFPANHKFHLYKQLVLATQGDLSALDFGNKIQRLARHFPYANDEFLAAIFHAGLDSRIRARLILDGIYFGGADLETLIKRASEHERTFFLARAYGGSTRPIW